MLIPKYWAKAEQQVSLPGSDPFKLWMWGFSEKSKDDAQKEATTLLTDRVARLLSGDHSHREYLGRPIREKIIEEIHGVEREPIGIITRNHYGALVLNTAKVAFVDIDRRISLLGTGFTFLMKRIFSRGSRMEIKDNWFEYAKEKVAKEIESRHGWGGRLYQTKAGLRLLLTHSEFDVENPEIVKFMESCKVDPLYLKLCHGQKCYRARLTPKPYRIKVKKPNIEYPYQNGDEEKMNQWLKEYENNSQRFSTCKLVAEIGTKTVVTNAREIIRVHDEISQVRTNYPLA